MLAAAPRVFVRTRGARLDSAFQFNKRRIKRAIKVGSAVTPEGVSRERR
jgi:hypothetical protein